jgi:ABC-type Fe3+ transport system permease subunit
LILEILFAASPPKVHINPNPKRLPGSKVLQHLVDGLAFWVLLAALAGVLIGAGVWALAAHGNNHHWSARGRSGALTSAGAALVIGGAAAIINFFADAGSHVR